VTVSLKGWQYVFHTVGIGKNFLMHFTFRTVSNKGLLYHYF